MAVRIGFAAVVVGPLWLLFAGTNQPGGGFVGGIVAGAAVSLRYVSGGLTEVRRIENDKGRFTLVFLCTSDDREALKNQPKTRGAPLVELTYNWDEEKYGEDRFFGHLAYEVDDIYAICEKLMKAGVTINRPPRDCHMAFVR